MKVYAWNIYFIYSCVNHKGFFIYKLCVWINFFQRMAIEMLFNSTIKIFSFEMNLNLLKINYIMLYIIEGNAWIIFHFFIWTNYQIRYELSN